MKKYTVELEKIDTGKRVKKVVEAMGAEGLKTKITAKLKRSGEDGKWRIVGWEL